MKIIIDKDNCYKSGQCFFKHPHLVKEGPDNYPELLHADVPDGAEADARAMMAACPSKSISLEE